MKNLVLLGPPGSGKGTQASKLVEDLGYRHLSTGDLLRGEIAKGSELGKKVKSVLDSGELVSDDLVIELILANADFSAGSYIFDGYPRNIEQAKTLDEKVLQGKDYQAVFFKINTDKLVNRLTNRRMCKDCGAIYNLLTKAPKQEGVCDSCGSHELYQRKDDHEEVIRNRMSVYQETINPVLDYYRSQSKLSELDADVSMEKVTEEIEKIAKA